MAARRGARAIVSSKAVYGIHHSSLAVEAKNIVDCLNKRERIKTWTPAGNKQDRNSHHHHDRRCLIVRSLQPRCRRRRGRRVGVVVD